MHFYFSPWAHRGLQAHSVELTLSNAQSRGFQARFVVLSAHPLKSYAGWYGTIGGAVLLMSKDGIEAVHLLYKRNKSCRYQKTKPLSRNSRPI